MRGFMDAYGSWNMIWNSVRRRRSLEGDMADSSSPWKRTLPAVGLTSCRMPLPTVVLPQPDSPTSATVRPVGMDRSTPSTA